MRWLVEAGEGEQGEGLRSGDMGMGDSFILQARHRRRTDGFQLSAIEGTLLGGHLEQWPEIWWGESEQSEQALGVASEAEMMVSRFSGSIQHIWQDERASGQRGDEAVCDGG